jgi:4-hydroxyphenylacetaldehyde oxime monooxygenase
MFPIFPKFCLYNSFSLISKPYQKTKLTLSLSHINISMVSQFLLVLPAILVPLLSFLYLKRDRQNKPKKDDLCLPPSPPKLPLIGHLHLLRNLPHRSLQKLSQKYGPIIRLRLGSVSTVVVSSAEMAKEVMKTQDLHCCSRPPSPGSKLLSYDYVDVAFAPYNEYWREMRKLFILELLSMRRVQSFAYAREAQVLNLHPNSFFFRLLLNCQTNFFP